MAADTPRLIEIDGLDDVAPGIPPPGNLEPPALESGSARDLEGEELRSLLGPDVEDPSEPFIGEERRRHAPALEQRVGRDRRPELDARPLRRLQTPACPFDDLLDRFERRAVRG